MKVARIPGILLMAAAFSLTNTAYAETYKQTSQLIMRQAVETKASPTRTYNLPPSSISGVPPEVNSGQIIPVTIVWPAPLAVDETVWAGMRHPNFPEVAHWMMKKLPDGSEIPTQKWQINAGLKTINVNVRIPEVNFFKTAWRGTPSSNWLDDMFNVFLQVAKKEQPTTIKPKTCSMTHEMVDGIYLYGAKINFHFDLGCNLLSDRTQIQAVVQGFTGWGDNGTANELFREFLTIPTRIGEREGNFEVTVPASNQPYHLCYSLLIGQQSRQGRDIFNGSKIFDSCGGFYHRPGVLTINPGETTYSNPLPTITGSMVPASAIRQISPTDIRIPTSFPSR